MKDQEAYIRKRKNMLYYNQAVELVNSFDGCTSVLDVGGGPIDLLSRVNYPTRTLVDICDIKYFSSAFIHGDFLTTDVPNHDIVICLQVIEHIQDKQAFAAKLLATANKYLLVSIPYKWDIGDAEHDGLDESDVVEWFVTPPTQYIRRKKSQRLFCLWEL